MIPREIDDLMWTIAEGTDQSAIEEFGDRYPNLREELLKRIRTIKALKSGSRGPKVSSVPTFQNTQIRPANWRLIWSSFAFAVLVISAFGVYKLNMHSTPPPEVTPVNLQPAVLPDVNVENPTTSGPHPILVQPNPSQGSNTPTLPNATNSPATPVTKLKSMKLESASLHAAILLIAEEDHLTVTIAKGTPNPTIKIDYQQMSPMDMLKDLGQQYAFTTVLDGDHAILIIPKKDEDEGQIFTGNR